MSHELTRTNRLAQPQVLALFAVALVVVIGAVVLVLTLVRPPSCEFMAGLHSADPAVCADLGL